MKQQIRGHTRVYDLEPGVPYRFGYYDNADRPHLVSRVDSDITWCGRVVWPTPDMLDSARLEDWWVFEDGRKKPSVCGVCKAKEKQYLDQAASRSLAGRSRTQAYFDSVIHPDILVSEALRMREDAAVVVTGSRSISDREYIAECLRTAWREMGPFAVLHHGGAQGVDRIAAEIVAPKVRVQEWPADWDTQGKAAGYLRNARMLDGANPDYVIVIWDGESNGTEHCWDLAKTRQIPYIAFLPGGWSVNRTGRNEHVGA